MSGLSLYYYMRVLKFVFVDEHPSPRPVSPPPALRYSVLICGAMTVLTFFAFSPLWDFALAAAASI